MAVAFAKSFKSDYIYVNDMDSAEAVRQPLVG